jgi:hypothetical protein
MLRSVMLSCIWRMVAPLWCWWFEGLPPSWPHLFPTHLVGHLVKHLVEPICEPSTCGLLPPPPTRSIRFSLQRRRKKKRLSRKSGRLTTLAIFLMGYSSRWKAKAQTPSDGPELMKSAPSRGGAPGGPQTAEVNRHRPQEEQDKNEGHNPQNKAEM